MTGKINNNLLTGIDDIDNNFYVSISFSNGSYDLRFKTTIALTDSNLVNRFHTLEDAREELKFQLKFNDLDEILLFNFINTSNCVEVEFVIPNIVKVNDQSILQIKIENCKWYKDLVRFVKLFLGTFRINNDITDNSWWYGSTTSYAISGICSPFGPSGSIDPLY